VAAGERARGSHHLARLATGLFGFVEVFRSLNTLRILMPVAYRILSEMVWPMPMPRTSVPASLTICRK